MKRILIIATALVLSHAAAWFVGRTFLARSEQAGENALRVDGRAVAPGPESWSNEFRLSASASTYAEAWPSLRMIHPWPEVACQSFLRDWYRVDPRRTMEVVGDIAERTQGAPVDLYETLDFLSLEKDATTGLRRLYDLTMETSGWGLHAFLEADHSHSPHEKLAAAVALPHGVERNACLDSAMDECTLQEIDDRIPEAVARHDRGFLREALAHLSENLRRKGNFDGAVRLLSEHADHAEVGGALGMLVRDVFGQLPPGEALEFLRNLPQNLRKQYEDGTVSIGLVDAIHSYAGGYSAYADGLLGPVILPMVRGSVQRDSGFDNWARYDGRQGATLRAWALRIPPEAENIDLFQKAVFSSFLCDPSMAVAWVGTLPPGWHRELAAAAAARTLRWRQRPDEAAACFDLITDPLVRERAKKDGVR